MLQEIHFKDFDASNLKIGIITARWNEEITHSLRDASIKTLLDYKIAPENILSFSSAGSFELPFMAKKLIKEQQVDAVIAIGCLIKGDTMHFEYICEAVSKGIMDLNLQTNTPVIFGVLTCLTLEQAETRSKGKHNHGIGWAKTALEMASIK